MSTSRGRSGGRRAGRPDERRRRLRTVDETSAGGLVVDHLRRRAAQRQGLRVGADDGETITAHRNGLRLGMGRLHRVDPRVDHDEIGQRGGTRCTLRDRDPAGHDHREEGNVQRRQCAVRQEWQETDVEIDALAKRVIVVNGVQKRFVLRGWL